MQQTSTVDSCSSQENLLISDMNIFLHITKFNYKHLMFKHKIPVSEYGDYTFFSTNGSPHC